MKKLIATLPLLLLACSTTLPPYDYSKEPDPRKREFVIGISDGLRITVWKNQELSTEAVVRPDGTITMPLVGDVQANGRTPSQLRDEIAKRLEGYLRNDVVSVSVAITEVNSYRFTVAGYVERPGMYESKQYVTVAEAIALAGGLNRFATPENVVIMRRSPNGQIRKIPINYTLISKGEHLEQNLVLISGDTVSAP